MFVIINAFKSIIRAKGRNLLIGTIVVAIAAASCVALSIRSAAAEAQEAGTDLVNITGTLSVDRQALMSAGSSGSGSVAGGGRPDMTALRELLAQYPELTLTQLQTYADSGYVKDFLYSGSLSLSATGDLEPYSTDDSSTTDTPATDDRGGPGGMGGSMIGGMRIAMGDFTVTGYSAEGAMANFVNGTAQITDGGMFDTAAEGYQCLISSELAAFNGLAVGDTMTLINPQTEGADEPEGYTLTIVGIYTDASSAQASSGQMRFSPAQDPANLICVSYPTLQSIADHSASVAEPVDEGEFSTALTGQLASNFVFTNKENYEAFEGELRQKGLGEYYVLSSTDLNSYEASLAPLEKLSQFAMTLLWVVLCIGGVVLVGINIINIRERKYEVGVLTAIGIKKRKVAAQFVLELLCVTLIAIFIGTGVGAAVSVPVSNNLLASQIEQMQTQSQTQEQNFGRQQGVPQGMPAQGGAPIMQGNTVGGRMMQAFGGSDVNYLDKINASITPAIIVQLMGLGVLLTLISSLAAVVFVLRYEPLKILANRA